MSQSGYTPIQLYYSTTASTAPLAANLSNGELAINITDGKLYYKDNGGVVQTIATKATAANSFSAGTTGLTPNTATTGAVTLAGTLITSNGGTGLSSYTAGDLPYYASGTALSKLGIGTSGQILTSSGTAPQWSTLSGVAVTTFSAGTTGFTPSSATSGAITLAGTLNVANGGTGLTTLTSGYIPYGNGTSAFSSSSGLTFDGNNFVVGNGFGTFQANQAGVNLKSTGAFSPFINFYSSSTTVEASIYAVAGSGAFVIGTGGAGAERMRVTSTGNVGIGTSSPTYKLDVSSTTATLFRFTNSSFTTGLVGYAASSGNSYIGDLTLGNTSNSLINFNSTNSYVSIWTNNTERMRIDSSGNVGIGTSSPAQQFVVSNGGAAGVEVVPSGGSQGGTYIQSYNRSGSAFVPTEFIASKIGFYTGSSPSLSALLDSSGNLGLGVTPSQTSGIAIEFGGSANNNAINFLNSANAQGWITSNAYYNGTNWLRKYASGTTCTAYATNVNGCHVWNYAGASTAGSTISWSEAMRIDSSGNLGIGGSPSSWQYNSVIQIFGNGSAISGAFFGPGTAATNGSGLVNNAYYNSGWKYVYIGSFASSKYEMNGNTHTWSIAGAGTAGNAISYTDAMTLDSSGNLLVGTTSTPSTGVCGAFYSSVNNYRNFVVYNTYSSGNAGTINSLLQTNANNTSSYHFVGNTGGNDRIYIYGNGNIVNSNNSYGTLSDIKLKENIVNATSKLADLMKLQVRNFNLKTNPSQKQIGFIAQEFEQIFPSMIDETQDKDDSGKELNTTTKSIKTTVLIPILVKALQELNEKFDAYVASHP